MKVASPVDISTLWPMMCEFNRLEEIEVEPARCREALETLLGQPDLGRVFLFESSESVLGYAVLTFNYDLEYAGRDAFLTELFVASPSRGSGYGKHMLHEIESAAAALDVKAVHPSRILLGKVLSDENERFTRTPRR
jgi:GNAT superfamily N-acetyltransferase